MGKKIRILAVAPNPQDGTCWYRCVSPFGRLQETRDDIELSVTKVDVTHADISRHDLLFMQRPVAAEHLNMIRVAKAHGLAVWCDWDDPYMQVPVDNPMHFVYARPEVQANLREIARIADVVSVSSLQLRADFSKLNARVALLPNGLDDALQLPEPRTDLLPIRRVLWRGGGTHTADLQEYTDAIVGAANADVPSHVFSFFGLTPHWLMARLPYGSAQVVGWCNTQDYFRNLPTLNPSIIIVPLQDTHFNRCKSNIAAIEGAWAGGAVLAPRWAEWHMPGVAYYDDPASFRVKLEKLMREPLWALKAKAAQTLAFVREELSVSRINEMRSQILDGLLFERAPKRAPKRAGVETPVTPAADEESEVAHGPAVLARETMNVCSVCNNGIHCHCPAEELTQTETQP